MSFGDSRWDRPVALTLLVVGGLMLAGFVLYAGWPLPRQERCTGDVCTTSFAVDWDRMDWAIPPDRISCKELNPGPRAKLMTPGEQCVVVEGNVEVSRQTYEQLRDEGARQRIFTVGGVGLVLVVTAVTATWVARRRRTSPRPPL